MLAYPRRLIVTKLLVVASALLLTTLAGRLVADEDKYGPAVPDVSRVDQDYALQGEFVGKIPLGKQDRVIALQIRTAGHGRYQAVQFDDGLPGQTRKPHRPTWLVGKRSGDFLVLSGGPWAILVHPDRCLLVDATGRSVGQLERVRRESPTLGASPPKGATVLFDGSGTAQLSDAKVTDTGLLMQGAKVLPLFQDFDLHLEFMLPYMPEGTGQGRANSGVYLESRYEVQILDSFAMSTTFNGCGSLYRLRTPDVNMCLPPLVWQTYDISFTAPRWASDGKKLKNARITVWQNGVKIQDNVEIQRKTGHGAEEQVVLLPILLQDHGTPVRFRNIWIVDRGATGWVQFPVMAREEEKAKARAALGGTVTPPAKNPPKPAAQNPPAKKPVVNKPAAEQPKTAPAAVAKPVAPEKPKAEPTKPAAKPAEKPAEKPAAEKPPVQKPAEKPATKEAPKPVAKPAEKPAEAKPAK